MYNNNDAGSGRRGHCATIEWLKFVAIGFAFHIYLENK